MTGRSSSHRLKTELFSRLCRFVREHWGIDLDEGKRDLVENRLEKLARKLGESDIPKMVEGLLDGDDARRLLELFDALSTNHTGFFREPIHFDCLVEELLRPLAEQPGRNRKLRLWSAACSNGAEPYTLSILCHELFGESGLGDVRILATDLSKKSLEAARRGEYSGAVLNGLSAARRSQYFESRAEGDARVSVVRPELRRIVTFAQLNLLQPWPMRGPFDAIFCRNVMIYFDEPTRRRLVQRLKSLLRPGGLLFLGCSENLPERDEDLEVLCPSAFRKLQLGAVT